MGIGKMEKSASPVFVGWEGPVSSGPRHHEGHHVGTGESNSEPVVVEIGKMDKIPSPVSVAWGGAS